ncbi:uncharacterized protein MELLADRAFT_108497 [Melampsora larici-populina 98AG31]|uniref:Uncharacterized protein n=1 Tax=Melampsora larici-populina (strain 98AG31 / pathotype 3-4-7) TaxID=747676 RepID=F4RTA0_MELLP|nr:uncharacterized protein MELLADRAFT_108497 [Melampsora larici-populina 98AG31]EGG04224.1 hypothetical protein MELLADRAFT_108497 [Melampsora larici-populina 98AG31]
MPEESNEDEASTLARTLLVCKYLTTLDLTPKQFMVTFMSSNHPDLIFRRRMMKVGKAFKQTRSIVRNFGRLSRGCAHGQANWESLILEEATDIVNAQDLPRGHFPGGAYVSSRRITPDYFSNSSEILRDSQVTMGMSFLHSLLKNKLAFGMNQVPPVTDDKGENVCDPMDESQTASNAGVTRGLLDARGTVFNDQEDEGTVMSMENMVFVKASAADQKALKLTKASPL